MMEQNFSVRIALQYSISCFKESRVFNSWLNNNPSSYLHRRFNVAYFLCIYLRFIPNWYYCRSVSLTRLSADLSGSFFGNRFFFKSKVTLKRETGKIRSDYFNSPSIYLFKVNNGNTTALCEICSKLIIKTPERRHWRHFDYFIFKF